MKRLGLIVVLLSCAYALAQVPNLTRLARGTVLSEPLPPAPVGQPVDYWAGVYLDQSLGCTRFTVNGATWLPCTATTADVSTAVASEASARNAAISSATSGLATSASVTAAVAAEATARGTAISTAVAPLATSASVTAAVAAEATARNTAISNATASLATSAAVTALAARVGTLEAQVSTLQSQVATLQASSPAFIPGTAVASGLSIPILGVQTSPVTSTVTGAKVGALCLVGTLGFSLAGATGLCEVSSANTVTTRWVSNTGALSALLAIPNGTYPLRVERLP